MNMRLAAAALCVSLAVPAISAGISKDDLKKALDANPDLVLDVLRQHHKEFFEVVSQAAQEEQTRRQKEAEETEKKDFEDSFKNPKKPDLSAKSHVRGSKSAKYTLVEYSDFQCPYCSRGFQTVEQLRKKYGNDLRFVYKNMPMPFHPQAMPAAKWFEAVALQSPDKAWEFHDKLFTNQDKLGEEFFKQTVKDLGLDVDKTGKDAGGAEVAQRIEADVQEFKKLGFEGTPGFLLNGIPVRGAYPVEHFESIMQRLSGGAPANASKGK